MLPCDLVLACTVMLTHYVHEHSTEGKPHPEHVPVFQSCTDRPVHVELASQHAMGNLATAYTVRFAPRTNSNAAIYARQASAG